MTTYFVTGVNRGIGLALVDLLSQNKSNTVIGTVRSFARAQTILDWERSNVHLIEIDMSQDVEQFIEAFKKIDSIAPDGVDVVIHNAGILGANFFVPISEYKIQSYSEVFEVNVLGAIKVYQAISPYLYKGKGTKRFAFISSVGGQIAHPQIITHGYGLSKAAVNFFMKQVTFENSTSDDPLKKNAVVFSVHPGTVETDMSVDFIKEVGDAINEFGLISPRESAENVIKTVATAKSGSFVNYDGTPIEF